MRTVTVTAVLALLVTVGVLVAGSCTELLAAAVVAVAIGVVVIALRGVEDLGIGLLFVAVITATWNAGPPVAPAALAASLALLGGVAVAQRRRIAVPGWVWVLGATILLIMVVTAFWPTDPGYLAGRTHVPIPAEIAATIPSPPVANLLNAVRWSIAALALPLAACFAVATDRRLAGWLAQAWALGATVNAAVALTDAFGLTAISARLISTVDIGGRQAGLGAQPNHLALAVALVAPVVTWRLLTARLRWPWAVGALVLVGGLASSGSRGGLVATALGVGLTLVALAVGRRVLVPIAGLTIVGAALAAVFVPQTIDRALLALRLSGADSAAESDSIRAQIATQALTDFAHSPVVGIGLPVMADGHNIYLQLLAAGGVVLLLGFGVAMVGLVLDGRAQRDPLATVLVLCTVVWLAVGLVENQIADAYLYVPFALVAGLAAARAVVPPGADPASVLVTRGTA